MKCCSDNNGGAIRWRHLWPPEKSRVLSSPHYTGSTYVGQEVDGQQRARDDVANHDAVALCTLCSQVAHSDSAGQLGMILSLNSLNVYTVHEIWNDCETLTHWRNKTRMVLSHCVILWISICHFNVISLIQTPLRPSSVFSVWRDDDSSIIVNKQPS